MAALALALSTSPVWAQEAAIRKALVERLPKFPKIDEVTKLPMGLYEVRTGTEIYYTDEAGDYLIEGRMVDTKLRVNLTQERIDKLTAIEFSSLPINDAIVWKHGSGARKMAVFSDPNCSYCRRIERDIQQLKDVTVYTFVYPVLGADSQDKAKNIWCSKDRTKAWLSWMIDGITPARNFLGCDTSAIDRNSAFGVKYKINGTPTLLFEDGKRVPGALGREEMEKQLATGARKN
jgi:thiol:disulfide interchange protein DsbC